MSLRNDKAAELTVAQIAAHLQTHPWNVTRQLQKFADGDHTRLKGFKVYSDGPGRGGQWRIWRDDYLRFLGIGHDPNSPDLLPKLTKFEAAAEHLGISGILLASLVRQNRWPHVTFGRSKYLTLDQFNRIEVLARDEDWVTRSGGRPTTDLPGTGPTAPDARSAAI